MGDQQRPRKHQVEAILFAVLAALTTGLSDVALEGLCGIPASLITIEFERVLGILDEVLGDLELLNDAEKAICRDASKSADGIIYYLDGCDFPLRIGQHCWMYKSHKKNCHRQKGIRAQVLIDSFWGPFRGMECSPAGLYNDQKMLILSDWNRPDALTEDNEYVGCDKGYWPTEHINVLRPFSTQETENDAEYAKWNKIFNRDRNLIERTFGIFQSTFRIFDMPWRRHKHLFGVALRVCMKLMNRWWMLDSNRPPGLEQQHTD